MLRLASARTLSARRYASFALPSVVTLDSLKSRNANFEGLFSKNTIDQLWFGRGQSLVDGLNESLDQAGTSKDSDISANGLLPLIHHSISRPELFGVYSYASLLYNLQFFFEGLKELANPRPLEIASKDAVSETPPTEYSNEPADADLKAWIVDSFGSVREFRTLLLNSALAIKGDGYTWLVAESSLGESHLRHEPSTSQPGLTMEPVFYNLAVANTYNSGTVDDSLRSGQVYRLVKQNEARIQLLREKQLENATDEINHEIEALKTETNQLQLGTVEEASYMTLFSDKKLVPLLCIDASMRNYLLDYGVFGKQRYLDNVWESIDWSVVARRAPTRSKQAIRMMGI